MDELTKEAIMSLLVARREKALKSLENNAEYQEISEKQDKNEKVVESILSTLDKNERITIRHYFEDEVARTNYEIDEAYIQGLRDCFRVIGFLKGDEIRI